MRQDTAKYVNYYLLNAPLRDQGPVGLFTTYTVLRIAKNCLQ